MLTYFIALMFFQAIWEKQVYYFFGFIFVVFISLIISVSQISIFFIYFQLCCEVREVKICVVLLLSALISLQNYHWWWRSFLISGGSAVYIFLYSIFYFVTKVSAAPKIFARFFVFFLYTQLEITDFVPILLYFSYSLLIAVAFWVLTGTIGFYAAFLFIRIIYGALKID